MNKRKIIGLLAATTLIFGGAGIAKAESAHQVSSSTTQVQDVNLLANTNVSGYACVINGNGNLVLYSNTQAKAVSGYVSVGEMLHILGQQGNLIKVQVEETGAVGYINKANVYDIIDASANNVVRMNRNAQVINVSSVVNVRTAPSMGAKVETTLTNGTQVRVTGKAGDWFRVSVNGVKGYIFGEYLECGNFTTSNVTSNSTSSSSTGSTSNGSGTVQNNGTGSSSSVSGTTQNSGTSSSSSTSGATQNNGTGSTSNTNGTTKIQSLQKQLSEQKSKLKDLNNKLDNMKNQLQKDKASASKIENEIPQIKNEIKNVENKIKDIEGQIKNEQQQKTVYEYVNCKSVYLKSEANTSSKNLGLLIRGNKVEVLSQSGKWTKVKVDGVTGYVESQYLSSKEPAPEHNESKEVYAYVNCKSVYVKAKDAVTSDNLKTLFEGNKVEVLSQSGKWTKVKVDGVTGYVESQYLSSKAPEAVKPADQTKPAVKPADQTKPAVKPADQTKPAVKPADQTKPAVKPADQTKPAVKPADQTKPAVKPADQTKPTVKPADQT
ncbi:SH3 domain-containing protein, partial [Clostridium mediterraneense]|uniref:SH3 domain-containing protein n=1 Tax=Clostridium mediterraneense TaxID=1805472 RepID=UPI0013564AA0